VYRGPQHPGMSFGPPVTPPVVKQLLIINAVIFVAQQALLRTEFTALFAVTPALVWQGGYLWQPFTYMWLHGSLLHVGMNCFVLWMFGSQMAMAWGTKRFLRFYLICGIGAGFIISLWPYLAVLLGISLYYAGAGEPGVAALAGWALVASALVSYAKARAESFIKLDAGILERGERAGLLDDLDVAMQHALSCGSLTSHLDALSAEQQRGLLEALEQTRATEVRWTERG